MKERGLADLHHGKIRLPVHEAAALGRHVQRRRCVCHLHDLGEGQDCRRPLGRKGVDRRCARHLAAVLCQVQPDACGDGCAGSRAHGGLEGHIVGPRFLQDHIRAVGSVGDGVPADRAVPVKDQIRPVRYGFTSP